MERIPCQICGILFSPIRIFRNRPPTLCCSNKCRQKLWWQNYPERAKESNRKKTKKWQSANKEHLREYNHKRQIASRLPRHKKRCSRCYRWFLPHLRTPTSQRFCSPECRVTAQKPKQLEMSKRWKNKIRFGGVREEAIKRDGNACKDCGLTIRRLIVHHIDEDKSNNDLDNLVTLCQSCHMRRHSRIKVK